MKDVPTQSVPSIGAYVPCFNNAATIRQAVQSVLAQEMPPAELLVIDDGSADGSAEQLIDLPIRVVHLGGNLGRGAARARAMAELRQEYVLCCDATNVLPPTFLALALEMMTDKNVAAVYGRITQPAATSVVARWRGRHLFKEHITREVNRQAILATYGTLVRASAVAKTGGYNPALRHTEDADLGARLLEAGYEVVYAPQLPVSSIAAARLMPTLERYWRWYAGAQEKVSWRGYWKNTGYALKAMAAQDLRAGDPLAAGISMVCPHYQFWKSKLRGISRRVRASPE